MNKSLLKIIAMPILVLLIIYDRNFTTEEEYEEYRSILHYLSNKWSAVVDSEKYVNYLRVGDLGETPVRISDNYPLSDQRNKGNWGKHELVSDEFNDGELNTEKWWPNDPLWVGHRPVYFHPKCVAVKDGQLQLTAFKTESGTLPVGFTHTSGLVKSKTPILYGYFEIEAKLMDSTLVSLFWLYNNTPEEWTEIDIFEIAAGVDEYRRAYNMNVHLFHSPLIKEHLFDQKKWIAPSDLADGYNVYGLEWNEEEIKWYIDGVLVRKRQNEHWHQPLYLIINNGDNPGFNAFPQDDKLPATYNIEYIRVWKNK